MISKEKIMILDCISFVTVADSGKQRDGFDPSRPPQFVASRNRDVAKNRHMGIESIDTQKPIN